MSNGESIKLIEFIDTSCSHKSSAVHAMHSGCFYCFVMNPNKKKTQTRPIKKLVWWNDLKQFVDGITSIVSLYDRRPMQLTDMDFNQTKTGNNRTRWWPVTTQDVERGNETKAQNEIVGIIYCFMVWTEREIICSVIVGCVAQTQFSSSSFFFL